MLDNALQLTTTATEESSPGQYPITGTIGPDPNYEITVVGGTLTVEEKIVPEIEWNAPEDLTYGEPLGSEQLNATLLESVAGDLNYDPVLGTVLDAGSHSLMVTFTPEDETAFDTATATVSITILPASLTIRALDQERVANTENPVFELTYEGFVNGDTETSLTVPPVAATDATVDSPPGEYAIRLEGAEAANYAITLENGTLTITEPEPTEPLVIRISRSGDGLKLQWDHREGLELQVSLDMIDWESSYLRALIVEDGQASILFSVNRLRMTSDTYYFRLRDPE